MCHNNQALLQTLTIYFPYWFYTKCHQIVLLKSNESILPPATVLSTDCATLTLANIINLWKGFKLKFVEKKRKLHFESMLVQSVNLTNDPNVKLTKTENVLFQIGNISKANTSFFIHWYSKIFVTFFSLLDTWSGFFLHFLFLLTSLVMQQFVLINAINSETRDQT